MSDCGCAPSERNAAWFRATRPARSNKITEARQSVSRYARRIGAILRNRSRFTRTPKKVIYGRPNMWHGGPNLRYSPAQFKRPQGIAVQIQFLCGYDVFTAGGENPASVV